MRQSPFFLIWQAYSEDVLTLKFVVVLQIEKISLDWGHISSINAIFQIRPHMSSSDTLQIDSRGHTGLLRGVLDYHLPMGQQAFCRVTLSFIKQPHCVHLIRVLSNSGHSSQILSLFSSVSLSARGWLGFNRSKKLTSFICIYYHS